MKPLVAEELATLLGDCPLARRIIVLPETTSTNDAAAQLGRDGAAEGTVVFAEIQSAGRGRLGRRWESAPSEGLSFSILLRPLLPMHEWPRLTTFAAVAIAEGVEEVVESQALIKWPNDIYLGEKKAAGILIESQSNGFAVLGIGVNVNQTSFPESLGNRAVSLRQVAGKSPDRQLVAVSILQRLASWYPKLHGNFSEIVTSAEARSCLRGRWLETDCAGSRISGVAEGLDENGALILRKSDGDLTTLSSGEVSIVGW